MNTEERFRTELEEMLDKLFPKGECSERGAALMLFTYAVIYFKEYANWDLNKLKVKYDVLERRNLELEQWLERANNMTSDLNIELAGLKGKQEHYGND